MAQHSSSQYKEFPRLGGIVSAVIVAIALVVIFTTYAASSAPSIEAEDATGSPQLTQLTDPLASQSKAIQFGAAATTPPPTTPPTTSGKLFLGVAIEPQQVDDANITAMLKQYKVTSLTAENAMKFMAIEPTQGQFNWADSDKIVNYAVANGMRVRGHNFVWYIEAPQWINSLTNDEVAAALKNHITQMMTRYKGKVQQWDVVNEAFNDDGTLRDIPWRQKLGDDYVAKAFQWAHEADPTAELYYNDYGVESSDTANGIVTAKADAVYNMVKDFKARGIPIDGVGLQTHSSGLYPGTGVAIEANIKRLATLGVKTEITELDVRNNTDPVARYAEVGKACKDSGTCTGVTTWGVYDGEYYPSDGSNPLIFDTNFQPKPAYTSLTQAMGLN